MRSTDRLLADSLLDGDAAMSFFDGRARVSQRHRNWRVNFPAFGALLDGDEERAQALAGNYATEAREIIGLWLALQEKGAALQGEELERRLAWMGEFWDSWRAEVFEETDVATLEGAPRERFTQVFDELSTRFRDDATHWLRRAGDEDQRPSLLQRIAAPLRTVSRTVEGFFFPSVRR